MRYYKNIFHCLFYQLVIVAFSSVAFASAKISTNLSGVFAYENAKRTHQIIPGGFSVISEDPAPFDGNFSQCAPVTDYNNWPKDIENKSIFPYLARHASINPTQYAEFCDFVEDWYQTSCAVVHYFPGGSEVIGSGSLIGGNCVSTARHNFNDVPTSHIFVRFFKYSIFSHKGKMFAQEESLDIPVIDTCCAINGLDAGYLELPFLESSTFNKYAKVLPIQQSTFGGSLSPGEYGMFHFAGGMHQISAGNMHDCVMGSWLHNDISIQAGPGSSGATVIGKWFDRTEGCGTSIYRKIGNEWGTSVERRLISFSHFTNSGATLDSISAPYLYDPHFLPSAASFSESGYEYLKWFWQEYAGQGGKHPSPAMYNVQDDHSNHHIIPKGDFFYLWHYINDMPTYQPVNDRLKSAILKQVKRESLTAKKGFYPKKRANEPYDAQLELYNRIRNNFNELLQLSYIDHYPSSEITKRFCWFGWNLFQGPDANHRTDDPSSSSDNTDLSEKHKPKKFNKGLWDCLKNPQTGLHQKIQALKQATLKGVPDTNLLFQLDASLATIIDLLKKSPSLVKTYPFNPTEWEEQGGKYWVKT
jgi:hypothetical protein